MTSPSFLSAALAICIAATVTVSALAEGDSGSAAAGRALDFIKTGEAQARHGHWTEAAWAFSKAVHEDRENHLAFYDLGVALAHLGRYGQAAEAERAAIKLNEKYTAAYVELGWILAQLRQFDEAERLEKQALELEPNDETAHKNLAAIRAGRDAGTAQDKAERAITAGSALYREGKLSEARSLFEEAIRLQPRQAAGHINLGVLLGDGGDLAGQLKEEKLAVQLEPKNPIARLNLGWAHARKGEWAQALPAYQRAIELDKNSIDAQIGQALALYHTHKPEAGIAVLKQMREAYPQAAVVRTALGRLFLQETRLDEANLALQEALKLEPANIEATFYLAAVKLKLGDHAESLELYKKLAELEPDNQAIKVGFSMAQAAGERAKTQIQNPAPVAPQAFPGPPVGAQSGAGYNRQLADR